MFKKSSYSNADGPCVDVDLEGPNKMVLVRDTKDLGRGPVLAFTRSEWRVFVQGVKELEFEAPED